MKDPRTRFVHGRPVTVPKKQAPAVPSGKACRTRLQSCGMVVGGVDLVRETLAGRIWHAETDRGPREVIWTESSGWSIMPIEFTIPAIKRIARP